MVIVYASAKIGKKTPLNDKSTSKTCFVNVYRKIRLTTSQGWGNASFRDITKPSNPLVLVLSLACCACFTTSTNNKEKRIKSLVSHQNSWNSGIPRQDAKDIFCKNKSHIRTIIISIKIICSKRISKRNKKKLLNFKSTYGWQEQESQSRKLSPNCGDFPGFEDTYHRHFLESIERNGE